jgi:hypothetical protein
MPTLGDRPTITGQTERPTWARTLRRRFDDADEPSQGTPVLRIASDDEPAVHRHPRLGSTCGVVQTHREQVVVTRTAPGALQCVVDGDGGLGVGGNREVDDARRPRLTCRPLSSGSFLDKLIMVSVVAVQRWYGEQLSV